VKPLATPLCPRVPSAPVRRAVGRTLEQLEQRTLFAAPVLDFIADQSVPVGKTLQLGLTASDADGQKLTYTITDNSGSVTTVLRSTTNTFIRMQTSLGTMEFQLFDDVAPDTVNRIVDLVKAGFYDGQKFHRVIENFVAQGGDPKSKQPYNASTNVWGTGGPEFRFDDEFDANVLFTGDAQLAMANSGKDTNGSQFFITSGPQRGLDFNHTIFGQLIRGRAVLTQILTAPVDSGDKPSTDIVIQKVSTYTNKTDAVLQIRTTNNAGGNITVTVSDGTNTDSQTFKLTGVTDTSSFPNTPPILQPTTDYVLPKSASAQTVNVPVTGFDLEGDAYVIGGQAVTFPSGVSGNVDQDKKEVQITIPANFTGLVSFYVGVAQQGATNRGSTGQNANDNLAIFDKQLVTIAVGDKGVKTTAGITGNEFAAGVSQRAGLVSFVDIDTGGKGADWNATSIDWGDGVVDNGEAAQDGAAAEGTVEVVKGSDGKFRVFGTHAYPAPGTYTVRVDVASTFGVRKTIETTVVVRALAELIGNILYVSGTSDPDTIGVSVKNGQIRANVNGVIKSFAAGSVGRVEIQAYAGDDVASLGSGVPATYIFGDVGDDSLAGGDGNDTLTGGAGKNTLSGGEGNDRINGSGGRDYAIGGGGDDRIYGNGGDDTLDGGGGVDRIWGGDGADAIFGGASNDRLFGEAGADTLNGQAGSDTSDTDNADTRISVEVLI
jgi:cyclophilin family peptidyl-prolyl cis-trans isomerase